MLRIGVGIDPPNIYNCSVDTKTLRPTSRCPKPGQDAEILGFVLELMKVPYEIVPFTPTTERSLDWGRFSNGTFSGLLSHVIEGSIDTLASTYSQTGLRMDYFDFTYPIYHTNPVFVIAKKRPALLDDIFIAFHVFRPAVWLSLIGLLLVMFLFIYLGYKAIGRIKPLYPICYWEYTRYAIRQCYASVKADTVSANVMVLVMGATAVLFCGLYETCLLGQLLLPKDLKPFDSTEQLFDKIETKKLTLISETDPRHHWWWFYQQVYDSELLYFQRLRDVFEKGSVQIENNRSRIVELLSTGRYVYPTSLFVGKLMEAEHRNLISYDEPDSPMRWSGYVFQKGSSWINRFHAPLITSQQNSYATISRYAPAKCNDGSREMGKPLTFISFSGVFCVCFIGLVISFVSFFIEHSFNEGIGTAVIETSRKISHRYY